MGGILSRVYEPQGRELNLSGRANFPEEIQLLWYKAME
jgi:hypothetical protein